MFSLFRKPNKSGRHFISHNSLDKPIARRLLQRLRMFGSDAYLDENDLRIGDQISSELKRNIRDGRFLLVIWTENARKSAWVGKEIEYAIRSRTPILPLLFTEPAGHVGIENSKGVDFRSGSGFEGNFLEVAGRLGLSENVGEQGFQDQIDFLADKYDWARRFLDLQELFYVNRASDLAALDYLPTSSEVELFELDTLCYAISKTAPPINLRSAYSKIFGYLTARYGVAFEAANGFIENCVRGRDNQPNVVSMAGHEVFHLIVEIPIGDHVHMDRVLELAALDPSSSAGWVCHIAMTTADGGISEGHLKKMLSIAGSDARNGWPVDLLIAVGGHRLAAEAASAKLITLLQSGQFDGCEDHNVTETPSLYLLAIEAFARRGQDEIAFAMAEKAARRVRDAMLNPPQMDDHGSRDGRLFCVSLWWLYNAIKMAPTKFASGTVWANKLEEALWDSDQYETIYYFWKEPLKSLMQELHDFLRARINGGLTIGSSGRVGLDTRDLNIRLGQVFENFGFERNLR